MLCWHPPAMLYHQFLAMSFTRGRQRHESKPHEVLQNLLPRWQQKVAMEKEKSWAGC